MLYLKSTTNLGKFDTTHVYHIKHSIFGVPVNCAGVGAAKFSKNAHVWCGSVRSEKLLCTECASVPKLAAHQYSDAQYHKLLNKSHICACFARSIARS